MRIHHGMLQQIMKLGLILIVGVSMNADAGLFGHTMSWKEEVKLHDGQIIGNGDAVHIGNFDHCGRVAAQQRGTHRRTPCGWNDVFNSSSISSFEFADGTTLTVAELLARGFDLDGTPGDGQMRWRIHAANDAEWRAAA